MNQAIAKYLFQNEVLYRNSSIEVESPILPKKVVESEVASSQTPKESAKKDENPPTVIHEIVPSIKLNQKVLILTQQISDSEKAFLSKILGAVGLGLDQVDLVELSKIKTLDYQSFIGQKATNQFISFGIGMSKLGWNILLPPYQIKKVEGISFLLADTLSDIEASQSLKKSLWEGLKLLF
ncbi:MAG: hypothetical protein MUF45_02680 [Spirosomaceae bacterium]|jgi:DNA polymerase III psi subunit|nr:hypothetical protein [Spirosomataceae bacterium]